MAGQVSPNNLPVHRAGSYPVAASDEAVLGLVPSDFDQSTPVRVHQPQPIRRSANPNQTVSSGRPVPLSQRHSEEVSVGLVCLMVVAVAAVGLAALVAIVEVAS